MNPLNTDEYGYSYEEEKDRAHKFAIYEAARSRAKAQQQAKKPVPKLSKPAVATPTSESLVEGATAETSQNHVQAAGKYYRKTITVLELTEEITEEEWLAETKTATPKPTTVNPGQSVSAPNPNHGHWHNEAIPNHLYNDTPF